jgi:hypothetical protein
LSDLFGEGRPIGTPVAPSLRYQHHIAVLQYQIANIWDFSPWLREAMRDAARRVRAATLLMVAQNDRTTASITTLASALQEQNPATEVIVYPPFFPSPNPRGNPPGHVLFSDQGIAIWANDVRAFLAKHLGHGISGESR